LLRINHVSEVTRSRHCGRVTSFFWPALAGAFCFWLIAGCGHPMTPNRSSSPPRDINAVLADHDAELLAIPGVVGVYVGLLKDEKTPCLKVMLAREDSRLKRRIPRSLEGHPVVTEVTGEIHPLK
jgi:hypothetical protein